MRPGDSHLKSPVSFAASNEQQSPLVVERLPNNPIIRAEMLPAGDGDNINGASLIGTPAWLPGRLGNYYLYFAHHRGTYIRLAYAQQLEGPWTIHRPGTLKLTDAHACRGHIASPDVHVDEKRRQIRMYFHGPSRIEPGQKSYLALSTDGLNFVARDAILGPFYFRVVRWRDRWIAMAKGGQVYVSNDGLSNFRCASVQPFFLRDPRGNDPGDVRHVAVHPRGDGLIVYFTRIGDCPERILRARIEPTDPDLRFWHAGPIEDVLSPERDWEGADLTSHPSSPGPSTKPENAVRDPAIFAEDDRTYLLYSVAGETGIAIAILGNRT
jgi:hypothetical protein